MPTYVIDALWFDYRGYGRSELRLALLPIPPGHFEGGVIPASLGMRVRLAGDGLVMPDDQAMVNGGFNLPRDEVEKLHAQLGAWLESTKP